MTARRSFVGDLAVVLRSAGFRRLFAVRLAGQLGDGAFDVALASYLLFSPARQPSATAAAAAFAVVLLPYSVLGPFAGVLLDRWRRRSVLVAANLVRTALATAVTGLVSSGAATPAFYALVLTTIGVNRFVLAGLGASLPHVVPAAELVMANAVAPTSGTVAGLVGAALGFGLRGLGAPDALVVAVAGAAWCVAGLLALRMAPDLLGPTGAAKRRPTLRHAARDVVAELAGALVHLRRRRAATAALLAVSGQRLAYGLAAVTTLLLERAFFADPADVEAGLAGLASVVAASGAGFAVGAVATPAATPRLGTRRWVSVLLLAAALVQLLPAAGFTEAAVLATGFALGVTAQGVKVCVDTIVQAGVDDAYRGRVFSVYDMAYNVAFVAGAVAAALVLPPDGRSAAVLVAASLVYVASAVGFGAPGRRAATAQGPGAPGGS